MVKLLTALALVFSPFVLSCGGGGGDGGSGVACGAITPCGGDVTGSWKTAKSCLSVQGTLGLSGCDAPFTSTPTLTISAKYNADKTYEQHVSLSGPATATVPASCLQLLPMLNLPQTCAGLQAFLQLRVAGTCKDGDAGGCVCTATLAGQSDSTGTYTVEGGVLTTAYVNANGDATTDRTDYCVTPGQVAVVPHADSAIFTSIGVKQATVSGSVVLVPN